MGDTADTAECSICWDRPSDYKLRPCGHDSFCRTCATRLSSCPLCRAIILSENGQPARPRDTYLARDGRRSRISSAERFIILSSCSLLWLGMLVGGRTDPPRETLRVELGPTKEPAPPPSIPEPMTMGASEPAHALAHTVAESQREASPEVSLSKGAALALARYVWTLIIMMIQSVCAFRELLEISRILKSNYMPRRALLRFYCLLCLPCFVIW